MVIERQVIKRYAFKVRVHDAKDVKALQADAEKVVQAPAGSFSKGFIALAKQILSDIRVFEAEK